MLVDKVTVWQLVVVEMGISRKKEYSRMRKLIVLLSACIVAATATASTQWLNSYVFVWNDVTSSDTWYDLNGSDQGQNFHGADLGYFNGANQLWMNSEINAQANGGDTFNYFSIYWRIGTSGAFTAQQDNTIDLPGGENYRGTTPGIDLIDAVGGVAGTYQVQVYLERSHSWGGGGPYITQLDLDGDTGGGAPDNFFQGQFTINAIPEPTTLVLVGLGIVGFLAYRRRR